MRVLGSSCSVSARRALVRGCVILFGLWAVPASTALASGNAGYSTYDTTVLGCLHGSGVNCNLYSSKDAVYMSGGPTGGSGLADGQGLGLEDRAAITTAQATSPNISFIISEGGTRARGITPGHGSAA